MSETQHRHFDHPDRAFCHCTIGIEFCEVLFDSRSPIGLEFFTNRELYAIGAAVGEAPVRAQNTNG